jgi:hypothetical protein
MRSPVVLFALILFTSTPLSAQWLVAILYEDLSYRQVFTDGRDVPAGPNPSWMGYSVGRWDGDTLVVTSSGFNERSWLDDAGHPHTESLRITERFRRRDFGHIDMQAFNDPRAYVRPWTISFVVNLVPDTELLEEVCNETDRSRYSNVGKPASYRTVTVSPELLKKYVGTYEVRSAANGLVSLYVVTLSDGRLSLDVDGVSGLMMVPLSETSFAPPTGGSYEFVADAQGVVIEMRLHGVSGMRTAVRRR